MTITNSYATLQAFYDRQTQETIGTDAKRDRMFGQYLERASRWIDNYCGRQFFTFSGTKYFSAHDGRFVSVEDLISASSIAVDVSGQRTYDITLLNTDYELEPYNTRQQNPPRPYTAIRIRPYSSQWFPTWILRGVQVVGLWGFADQTVAVTTVDSGAIDDSSTTLNVTTGDGVLIEPGMVLLAEDEQMFADSVSTDAVTVRRGVNGTTAAAHAGGTAVSYYDFGDISEACLMMAARLWKRKDAILGVSANTQLGPMMLKVPEDKDVTALLEGYRRLV